MRPCRGLARGGRPAWDGPTPAPPRPAHPPAGGSLTAMDPVAALAFRLAQIFRSRPGRRKALAMLAMLVALVLALGIGVADRVFGLFPAAQPQGGGPGFRWR